MRVLVFVLVLANLLFFLWDRGSLGGAPAPDAKRLEQQLSADQIRIVTPDDPSPAAPEASPESAASSAASEASSGNAAPADKGGDKGANKAGNPPKNQPISQTTSQTNNSSVPEACLQLNALAGADLSRVETLVAEQFPAFRGERLGLAEKGGYWVYIPSLSGKAEAERKAAELQRLRVPELFVIQDAGPNRFAISLGIFSSREKAAERLNQLREMGVRSAKIGEREAKAASGSLLLRGPAAQADAVRKKLRETAAKYASAECKAPAAAKP